MISIDLCGHLDVRHDAKSVPIVSSRKTRALLGFLVLSNSPQRRDRLCELFWEIPDDPRGALRWSLSKLRPLVNEETATHLIADRERVRVEVDAIDVDIHRAGRAADDEAADARRLVGAWEDIQEILLSDCELANHRDYMTWLGRERDAADRLRARLAERLLLEDKLPPAQRPLWADRWLDHAPFDRMAAGLAVRTRRDLGMESEASSLEAELRASFAAAQLGEPFFDMVPSIAQEASRREESSHPGLPGPPQEIGSAHPDSVPTQRVRFVAARDGACIAWASVGAEEHPPLVKAANWLSHLELDWEAPIWSPLFRNLACDHQLVRYDERGCGLSDWDVKDLSLETFVSDLEIVVDAAGLDRFPLLGISQGAAVSIEYAVRHPDRLSQLILFGGYPVGWRHTATPEEVREREAIMVLTERGWGRRDPIYRRLFSQTFMPDATTVELNWFDDFQRRTCSPENAIRFLEAFAVLDVRDRLEQIQVPTLVIHSRGDHRIPLATGRGLAARIPNAEFVSLESNNHLLIGREPASATFVEAVRAHLRK